MVPFSTSLYTKAGGNSAGLFISDGTARGVALGGAPGEVGVEFLPAGRSPAKVGNHDGASHY